MNDTEWAVRNPPARNDGGAHFYTPGKYGEHHIEFYNKEILTFLIGLFHNPNNELCLLGIERKNGEIAALNEEREDSPRRGQIPIRELVKFYSRAYEAHKGYDEASYEDQQRRDKEIEEVFEESKKYVEGCGLPRGFSWPHKDGSSPARYWTVRERAREGIDDGMWSFQEYRRQEALKNGSAPNASNGATASGASTGASASNGGSAPGTSDGAPAPGAPTGAPTGASSSDASNGASAPGTSGGATASGASTGVPTPGASNGASTSSASSGTSFSNEASTSGASNGSSAPGNSGTSHGASISEASSHPDVPTNQSSSSSSDRSPPAHGQSGQDATGDHFMPDAPGHEPGQNSLGQRQGPPEQGHGPPGQGQDPPGQDQGGQNTSAQHTQGQGQAPGAPDPGAPRSNFVGFAYAKRNKLTFDGKEMLAAMPIADRGGWSVIVNEGTKEHPVYRFRSGKECGGPCITSGIVEHLPRLGACNEGFLNEQKAADSPNFDNLLGIAQLGERTYCLTSWTNKEAFWVCRNRLSKVLKSSHMVDSLCEQYGAMLPLKGAEQRELREMANQLVLADPQRYQAPPLSNGVGLVSGGENAMEGISQSSPQTALVLAQHAYNPLLNYGSRRFRHRIYPATNALAQSLANLRLN